MLWWLGDSPELADGAGQAIADRRNEVLVSAATVWELAIKRALGRLRWDDSGSIADRLTSERFTPLAVDARHAETAAALPDLHADPFDPMLVAQAGIEGAVVVTRDRRITAHDVRTILC